MKIYYKSTKMVLRLYPDQETKLLSQNLTLLVTEPGGAQQARASLNFLFDSEFVIQVFFLQITRK